MNKRKKKELVSNLFHSIDNEGVGYYFTQYGPDYDAFEELGFDVKKIKDAAKKTEYLYSVFGQLEDMLNELEEENA